MFGNFSTRTSNGVNNELKTASSFIKYWNSRAKLFLQNLNFFASVGFSVLTVGKSQFPQPNVVLECSYFNKNFVVVLFLADCYSVHLSIE
jgi:hypothetical protein